MLSSIFEILSYFLLANPEPPAPPRGRYQNADGTMAIEALPGKTLVYLPAHLAPFTVTVKRNKIFATTKAGPIKFVYNHFRDRFTGPDKTTLEKMG